jgi:3-methyladenine DNA glycosylase/8-oxoguanine DNA glycosylase
MGQETLDGVDLSRLRAEYIEATAVALEEEEELSDCV